MIITDSENIVDFWTLAQFVQCIINYHKALVFIKVFYSRHITDTYMLGVQLPYRVHDLSQEKADN
jgi:hypothetical protein